MNDPEILNVVDHKNVVRLAVYREKKDRLERLKDAVSEALCDGYMRKPAVLVQAGINKAHDLLDKGKSACEAMRAAEQIIETDGGTAA